MKKFVSLFTALALCVSIGSFAVAQEKSEEAAKKVVKPKYTVKEVMKKAMKEGLLKKVSSGRANDKEKLELLDLMVSLTENKPPKGEMASWNKFAANAALAAAKAAVGREDAAASLKMHAANCKGCHGAHKPKK